MILRWPAVRLCAAASLLVVVGCQRDPKAPRPQADAAEHQTHDEPPAKSAASGLLVEQPDGFFEYSLFSSKNLDRFIAEINERDIRKLKLKPHSWSHVPNRPSIKDQLSVLPEILRGYPAIEALKLDSWTLKISDLAVAVQSENLQELSVLSCIVVDDHSEVANPGPSNLQKLTVTSCLAGRETATNDGESNIVWTESIDEQWAQLLAWTPNIEELSVRGSFRKEGAVIGNDWPLAALANLRTVQLGDYVQDSLVEKLLSEVPNLESLSLWGDQFTGEAWMPTKLSAIRELELYGCKGILADKLEGVFQSAPRLESFRLTIGQESLAVAFDLSQSDRLRKLSIAAPNGRTQLYLKGLPSLVNLESLTLRGLPSKALENVELSQFNKLRTLDIASYGATQAVISNLPSSLESIRLSGFAKTKSSTTGSDATFSHLAELQSFSFSDGGLEAELIESLPTSVESLSLHHCGTSDQTIAALLSRLDRLETLSLTWLNGARGYEDDPDSLKGEGWDFACRDRLRTLDLSKCFYIKDELISRISEQLTGLESLKLSDHTHLTGRNWRLDRLPHLKNLDLREMPKLTDGSFQQLPVSLESLRVEDCDGLTGESWQLNALAKLTELRIRNCRSLRFLGNKLPDSLTTLTAYYCPQLRCSNLDYSSFAQLQSFSMTDCYQFDVKRLFMELPQHARVLRTLTLTGCESLNDSDWDMSALNDTLQIVTYDEAEPAYAGGLDEKLGVQLQQQLPDCVIVL